MVVWVPELEGGRALPKLLGKSTKSIQLTLLKQCLMIDDSTRSVDRRVAQSLFGVVNRV